MEHLTTVLIYAAVFLAIFLLLREVNCWYWKINKAVALLEDHKLLLMYLKDSALRTEQILLGHPTGHQPVTSQIGSPAQPTAAVPPAPPVR